MKIHNTTEPISKFNWTIHNMASAPSRNDSTIRGGGDVPQSLIGEIITGAVKESGAKWVLSPVGRMWVDCMNLDVDTKVFYNNMIASGYPHCQQCSMDNWQLEGNLDKLDSTLPVKPCFDCDSEEVLKQLAIRQERNNKKRGGKNKTDNLIKKYMRN